MHLGHTWFSHLFLLCSVELARSLPELQSPPSGFVEAHQGALVTYVDNRTVGPFCESMPVGVLGIDPNPVSKIVSFHRVFHLQRRREKGRAPSSARPCTCRGGRAGGYSSASSSAASESSFAFAFAAWAFALAAWAFALAAALVAAFPASI